MASRPSARTRRPAPRRARPWPFCRRFCVRDAAKKSLRRSPRTTDQVDNDATRLSLPAMAKVASSVRMLMHAGVVARRRFGMLSLLRRPRALFRFLGDPNAPKLWQLIAVL